jgi:hypothetical protein
MNNGMVSIVEDKLESQMVYVRARQAKFLHYFMGEAQKADVVFTKDRDYQYRIHVTKAYAGFRVAEHVMNINYTNFKNSVPDDMPDLKAAYHQIWATGMNELDSRSVHTVWDVLQSK